MNCLVNALGAMRSDTFYPTRPDGLSAAFEFRELADDGDAELRALDLLEQHTGAASVVTYCGTRKVVTRRRMDPALKAVLSREPSVLPPERRTFRS